MRVFDNLKLLLNYISSRDLVDDILYESYLLQKFFFFHFIENFLTSFEIIDTQTQFDIDLKYQKSIEFFFVLLHDFENFSLNFI